ncbi:MAG: GAF domain-containing protein [Chloroflexi bacterium]|nr:GAF domain-containing protein [Chloroflexota bacterium]
MTNIRLHEGGILALIHRQASKLMDTDNMYIALYDEATDTVRFPLAFVDGNRIDVTTTEGWQPRKAGKGRTEEIIRSKQPLFSATKAESEAWYGLPGHEEYVGRPFASWLGVPMMVGDKVLGVIATYHLTRDYVYNRDDREILQAMANQAAIALDNTRLFDDLQERIEELEGLQAVGMALTSESDLEQLLSRVTEKAAEVLEADLATVYLYDRATNEFYLPILVGAKSQPLPSKDGIAARVIEGGELVIAEDSFVHPLLKDSSFIRNRGVKSSAAIPLKYGKEPVGILFINYVREPHRFTDSDKRAIRIFADQAATAINMAGLLYDAKRQLETVQEVVRAVEVHAKLPDYLQSILNLTLGEVGARDGTIQLLDKATNELIIRARAGKLAQKSHEYERIPLSKGITGRAARDKQTAYASNIEQADDYLVYIEGTRSEIAVPMIIGRDQPGDGRLIGVLNVESPVADAFKPYSRGLLERIADQAAVLIQQKIEAEELEARRLAAEVSAGVGMVTAEVAHHVKNLAGIIRTCDKRLSTQLSGLTTQQVEDLNIILQNAQGIMEAADDLFKPYNPEPKAEVSIALILAEALSVIGAQPDIGIQVNLAPDLPRVQVQAQKIQSYIVEILDNAIKFTRRRLKKEGLERGQVEVSGTCVQGSMIELAFTNHGPAIARERWEGIFRLFSADAQGQSEPQSYGLGLWGARTALRLHGGDVYVLESNAHQTTFLMRLPV